jgi:hypothetical protein
MIEWCAGPKAEADMDGANRWSSEHEAQRAQANRAELIARLAVSWDEICDYSG